MPLHQNLLRGIYSHGFENPSAIQQRAVVPMIQGGDIIAQAQSGTGKTGTFSIAMLQRMDFRTPGKLQGLVVCPTRELARQSQEVIAQLGAYLERAARGGTSTTTAAASARAASVSASPAGPG